MKAYTVYLPGGTKDHEYRAYVDLLREWGIDVERLARVDEPGSDRRRLHVWDFREEAERFAALIRERTRNPEWTVGDADDGRIAAGGPDVADPVTILLERGADGTYCRLRDADRDRIRVAFPTVRVVDSIFISEANLRAMAGSVWEPWHQIAIVLTGLNESQWAELGGIRVIEAASGRDVWSEAVPTSAALQAEVSARLDRLAAQPESAAEVLGILVSLTYGRDDAILRTPHPPPNGYEATLWPWNRVGGKYLERGQPEAAADVFAACYLCLAGLQRRYHFRTHKGMPLCNIGVAMARTRDTVRARIAWTLGLIEDLLTDAPSAFEKNNYLNLLATGARPAGLQALAQGITSRFVEPDVLVTQPELAWDVGFRPQAGSFAGPLPGTLTQVLLELEEAFPALPGKDSPSHRLFRLWTTLTIPQEFAGESGR